MKRILVGLDGSHHAPSVLAAALTLARQEHAKLVIMRALTMPKDLPLEACRLSPDEIARLSKERAERDLTFLARDVPPDFNGGLRTEIGTPWQAICDAAKEEKVDLIFIGTHSRDALDRVMGSTAISVLENADRSVFVFREGPPPKAHEQSERRFGYELF